VLRHRDSQASLQPTHGPADHQAHQVRDVDPRQAQHLVPGGDQAAGRGQLLEEAVGLLHRFHRGLAARIEPRHEQRAEVAVGDAQPLQHDRDDAGQVKVRGGLDGQAAQFPPQPRRQAVRQVLPQVRDNVVAPILRYCAATKDCSTQASRSGCCPRARSTMARASSRVGGSTPNSVRSQSR